MSEGCPMRMGVVPFECESYPYSYGMKTRTFRSSCLHNAVSDEEGCHYKVRDPRKYMSS